MPSFSKTLEDAIHAALAIANSRRHELATLEHLLLALLDEPDAAKVMQACSVGMDDLRKTLNDFIDDDLSTLVDVEEPVTESIPVLQHPIQRCVSQGLDAQAIARRFAILAPLTTTPPPARGLRLSP